MRLSKNEHADWISGLLTKTYQARCSACNAKKELSCPTEWTSALALVDQGWRYRLTTNQVLCPDCVRKEREK